MHQVEGGSTHSFLFFKFERRQNTMRKNSIKKIVKRGLLITLVLGMGSLIYGIATTESTPSCGLPEDADDISMYDDMEFYHLTHNEDGSLNDYGKSLD